MSVASVLAGCAAAASVLTVGAWRRPRVRRPLARDGEQVTGPDRGERRRNRRAVIATMAVGVVTAIVLVGPGLTAVGSACAVGALAVRRRNERRATQRAIDAGMPDAIELIVMCLHAGLTPTQAVTELARVAPRSVRPAFQSTEQRLHRGAAFADALAELSAQCGHCAAALVTALGTAVRDGLPLAPVLDRLTDEAGAERRRAGEAAARRLPVRLSFPLVACTLPSFVLLAIAPAVLGALSTVRGSPP